MYRTKTHTEQYLNFISHYPLHQNLGVILNLVNRARTQVSEKPDHQEDIDNIKEVLRHCGYPEWPVTLVENRQNGGKSKKLETKSIEQKETPELAVVP